MKKNACPFEHFTLRKCLTIVISKFVTFSTKERPPQGPPPGMGPV